MLVVGSGRRVWVARQLPTFSRIEITSSGTLEVDAGQPQSVRLEIDDNIVDLIRTEVKNDTLIIGAAGRYRAQQDLRLKVALQQLTYLGVPGAASAALKNVRGQELTLNIGGAATIHAAGSVERVELTVDGMGGDLDLYDLIAKRVAVRLAGVGNAKVTATESLQAAISGMGRVTYRGNPSAVEREILGMGSVSPAGERAPES
jgi:hypothetical protein